MAPKFVEPVIRKKAYSLCDIYGQRNFISEGAPLRFRKLERSLDTPPSTAVVTASIPLWPSEHERPLHNLILGFIRIAAFPQFLPLKVLILEARNLVTAIFSLCITGTVAIAV